jgi:flagellar FliL protein
MSDDKKAKKDDKKEDKDKKKGADEKEPAEAHEGEEGAEGIEEEDGKGKRKFTAKKIVLFVVVPLFLIGGGGAAAYFTGMLDKFMPKHELKCEEVKEGDEEFEKCAEQAKLKDATLPGVFLDIPSMIVNLSSTSKQPRFLKVTLKLELENAEEQKKIEEILPRVIDQFQLYLRELRIEDLQGTSGIYRMKIELLSRVRAAAPNIKVRDVLFQEALVQ